MGVHGLSCGSVVDIGAVLRFLLGMAVNGNITMYRTEMLVLF